MKYSFKLPKLYWILLYIFIGLCVIGSIILFVYIFNISSIKTDPIYSSQDYTVSNGITIYSTNGGIWIIQEGKYEVNYFNFIYLIPIILAPILIYIFLKIKEYSLNKCCLEINNDVINLHICRCIFFKHNISIKLDEIISISTINVFGINKLYIKSSNGLYTNNIEKIKLKYIDDINKVYEDLSRLIKK